MPVILTADYPPAHGGIQRYAARLAQELFASGHRLLVVAPDSPGAPQYDEAAAIPVLRYRGRSRAGRIASMVRAGRLAARRTGDGWVIAMSWNPAGIAARLLRPRRLTVLAHGSEIARQTGARAAALRTVLRGVDVVANSRFTAQLLAERGVAGVRIVPCGVDVVPSTGREAAKAVEPTILSVGRLVRRKGYDRLIQALPATLDRVPEARLVIIGDGPDRVYLEQLARESGVGDRVHLLGEVDDRELGRRFDEAWCFAMPNRSEGHDVEGFGIVFLEAAVHGLPSVGGRGSGADDAIEDGRTGFLVDPNDVGAVASALIRLLTSRERSVAMGAAGRARALEGFRWSSVAERIVHGA